MQYKKMIKTDDENTSTKKMIGKTNAIGRKSLPIVISGIALLACLWVIICRLEYSTEPGRDDSLYVHIGVSTLVFGGLLFVVGLAIVADLVLGWSDQLQPKEETDNNQGLRRAGNEASRETKKKCKLIIRVFATIITMFLLLWTIYAGIEITSDNPRIEDRYNQLVFVVGVTSIGFGLVYFIIGLAIAKELIEELSGCKQPKTKGNRQSVTVIDVIRCDRV